VPFDLRGNGRSSKFAWTAADSDDAWLVLDRNGNGIIDDGTELFGNFTEQPSSDTPNGFIALAVFDGTEVGGNKDGRIDVNDGVFNRLRLWQDRDHDGNSLPSEFLTLSEAGVRSLGLDYSMADITDTYGNNFRYVADVRGEEASQVAPLMYDVFLSSRSSNGTTGDSTTNRLVWRWRCSATCRQDILPVYNPDLYCQPPELNKLGPFRVLQDDACLAAMQDCVRTLLTDTTHCTLGAPIFCGNCYRTTVSVPDDVPEGCG
jgi:hypothetical protein